MKEKKRGAAWGRRLLAALAVWAGLSWLSSIPRAETLQDQDFQGLPPPSLSLGLPSPTDPFPQVAQYQPSDFRRRPELSTEEVRTEPLILPLPAFATSPNKGDEFGLLPVVLFFDKQGKVENILAPSAIFNTETGLKGAFRWLGYLPNDAKYRFIAIQSLDVDSDFLAEFEAPRLGEDGRWAASVGVRFERDPTEVFFGFGPDSRSE
ncbi:MAG: hypothetical protein HYY21_03155, partial [Candidatus Tectomicrobia bacterium]|nr:hypothetical protein [Candidatus Tectomicrobia bacterium]